MKLFNANEFLAFIAEELELEGPLGLELHVRDDLELDSMQVLEMVLLVEDLGGVQLTIEQVDGVERLGDLYTLYTIGAAS